MRTKILITGGTGLLGSALSKLLTESGYEVVQLSRRARESSLYKTFRWDISKGQIESEALNVDYIIHLAGTGIAEKRWTKKRKEQIYSSRVNSTRLLFEELKKSGVQLKGFISASAIGFYGADSGLAEVTEDSGAGEDFISRVVLDWEKEAENFSELKIPVTKLRIGIVLSKHGGALPKLAAPIRYGVGAPLGTGKQFMSWIHEEDLCQMFKYVIEAGLEGTFNAVAPEPVSNGYFTRSCARTLNRPLFLPNIPSFALRLMFGELAELLLGGNNVSSAKIQDAGFHFEYDNVKKALKNLL